MEPQPERDVVVSETKCSNGHRINLHIVPNSPRVIQMVKCPVCGVQSIGLMGQLVSVLPIDSGL